MNKRIIIMILNWLVLIGVVMQSIQEIRIIKWIVSIIQVGLNLGVRMDSGLKDGLAAEVLGMNQDVSLIIIEDILLISKWSFVLIMENQIPNQNIQIVFVENHLLIILNWRRKINSKMIVNVLIMQVTLELKIRKLGMEYGVVVHQMKRMENLVQKKHISSHNGQMRMPRSTFLISLSRTHQRPGMLIRRSLTLSYMEDSQAYSDILKSM
jgi:hypothetical protein